MPNAAAYDKLNKLNRSVPVCWNWQTRRTQNPLLATACGFESHHRHHRRTLIWIQLGPFFFAPLPFEKVLIPWDFSASRTRIVVTRTSGASAFYAIFPRFQQKSPSRQTLKSCARWGNRVQDGYFVYEIVSSEILGRLDVSRVYSSSSSM